MNDWISNTLPNLTRWVTAEPNRPYLIAGAIAAFLVALLGGKLFASLRSRDLSARANLGFAVVQGGFAYITITGTYDFWINRFDMPWAEAAIFAVIIEAAVWAAVGMIYVHGVGTHIDDSGRRVPNVGFGPAGPFFWLTIVGGGALAVLGSSSVSVALGRAIIVIVGANMWYLRLLQKTHRATTRQRSRWAWTPHEFLLWVGALRVTADDLDADDREWQVRRLARAIRWRNGNRVAAWFGKRALTKRGESTTPDVLAEARARYAVTYVLNAEVSPDSEQMRTVIDAARQALAPQDPEPVTLPAPAPEPERLNPEPVVPDVVPEPVVPPAPKPPGNMPRRRPRPTPEDPAAKRARAEDDAYARILSGQVVTSAAMGEAYGLGEEWGRQRIVAARARIDREASAAVDREEAPVPATVG